MNENKIIRKISLGSDKNVCKLGQVFEIFFDFLSMIIEYIIFNYYIIWKNFYYRYLF